MVEDNIHFALFSFEIFCSIRVSIIVIGLVYSMMQELKPFLLSLLKQMLVNQASET